MTFNETMTSYKKRLEFKIIGLENCSKGINDGNAPSVDSVNANDEIYFIFVIYLCIALVILVPVVVWLIRKKWNAYTKSRQEAAHVDFAHPECSQKMQLD